MQSVFIAAADDRSQAQHTASRLISNAYRVFTVLDGATEQQAADYIAELQAAGVEAWADSYIPEPRIEHGNVALTPAQRSAMAAQQLRDNPHNPPSVPKVAYGRQVVQDPSMIRVRARYVGYVGAGTAGGEDAPAQRGRRIGARAK